MACRVHACISSSKFPFFPIRLIWLSCIRHCHSIDLSTCREMASVISAGKTTTSRFGIFSRSALLFFHHKPALRPYPKTTIFLACLLFDTIRLTVGAPTSIHKSVCPVRSFIHKSGSSASDSPFVKTSRSSRKEPHTPYTISLQTLRFSISRRPSPRITEMWSSARQKKQGRSESECVTKCAVISEADIS